MHTQKKIKARLIANRTLDFQNEKKAELQSSSVIIDEEGFLQATERGKRAANLILANKELTTQNKKITQRTIELLAANKELVFRSKEKEKRAAELIVANKQLLFQNKEKAKQAAELLAATKKLAFANREKEKLGLALFVANKEIAFGNDEKQKLEEELILSATEQTAIRNINEDNIRHLAAIVEYSDDAIISTSLNGMIQSWNRGGEKMFGYKAGEAIGKNISLIIPPKYLDEEKIIHEKISKNETIDHSETIGVKRNGERLHVAITISPLKDWKGNTIGISKIIRDITLNKLYEQQLLEANESLFIQNSRTEKKAEELEMVNRELESFSYSVSHDLRSPLRAINGFAQIMIEDYLQKLDGDAKVFLEEIMSNALTMSELIDNLLAFSRIGKQNICMADVNIKKLADEIIEKLKREEPGRKIKIKINELANIEGDRNMLKQVFINLISNAFKYTGKTENAVIEIGSYVEDDYCIYYVKDNGAGFDMDYFDKLFGVFQRLHSNNEFEGTGVGLAIVQKIVTKHGGKVWAEGKVNEGATFYISLPVAHKTSIDIQNQKA